MYEIPSEFFFELHHSRPRFKKDKENVFGNMAFSIVELDGTTTKYFKKNIDIAIRNISGNEKVVPKTIDNWRTEITTLFSMKQQLDDGKVYATDITKELANTSNLKRFFLRAMLTFQYPGGFLTSRKIKRIVEANIVFNPLLWLSHFFTSSKASNGLYITELEFCYCVLNDLRVTSRHEEISLTYDRILENRKKNVGYNRVGDKKRSAGDILDYCVLAGILYEDKSKRFQVKESAIPLLQFFKSNHVLFKNYSNTNEPLEINNLKNTWINFVNNTSRDLLQKFSMENNISLDNDFMEDANSDQLEPDDVNFDYKELKLENLNRLYVQISSKELGDKGELLAQIHEKLYLRKTGHHAVGKRVKRIPDHLAVGYDILSRKSDATMRQIEVKTTMSQKETFIHKIHLTENEWCAAKSHGARYYIYRIAISDNEKKLRIIKDPYSLYEKKKIKVHERDGVDLTFDNTCYEEVELLEYRS